eukprot:gnl/Dysnectes_brevis/137_a162_4229.p1 GENE.gnl/Dysnectes_brevis/137_a162_4229~~gnl/Dysnectes_brevis/137_a162_4229.p1  ORF type:complete len:246 (-),score=50.64 gnl/Dysnectes_brevis/137_a162_4229:37-774(-)
MSSGARTTHLTYEAKKAKRLETVSKGKVDRRMRAVKRHSKHRTGPPSSGAFTIRKFPASDFRLFYDRGDLPIAIEHTGSGNKLMWKANIEMLDFHHYLPIFFEGLREKDHPYAFLAREGVTNMLEHGRAKVLPVIPQLIIPIKTALNTRDPEIICVVLHAIQLLVLSNDFAGQALVPYYRQILPILNLFASRNVNIGDSIYYGQRHRKNVGDLIWETLELLERHGGSDAYVNLKFLVPTYTSCML